MNKNFKKTLALLISVMTVTGTTFSAFADIVDATNQVNQERKVPENMIIGKITSIDATNVTIQVATRKAMEKKENGENGNLPEKPENGQLKQDETTREKPNMDEMFTLTGETKTINIASAEFGNKKPENENASQDANTNNKNWEKKTYADYKVGDYIAIQATDDTYKTAKRVNSAMFGRMRGFKRNGEKRENQSNSQ